MKEFFIKQKIRKCKKRLEDSWDDPLDFRKIAELYLRLSQTEEAVSYYHHAIEAYYRDDSRLGQDNEFILEVCWSILNIEPLDILAHRTLGQEYCGLGEFEEAINLHTSFGKKLVEAGRYDDAIQEYRNALVLDPDNIGIRQTCFSLYWKLHRKQEALQELENIASIAKKLGKVGKALECYKKALKIVPDHPKFQAEFQRLAHVVRSRNNQLRLVVNK